MTPPNTLNAQDSHFLSLLMERINLSRKKHPVGPPTMSAILYYVQALQGHMEAMDAEAAKEAALSIAAMSHRVGVEIGRAQS